MNWKPVERLEIDLKHMQELNIRLNISYDRTDGISVAFSSFQGKKDQFLFSLDTAIHF
ncbi:hypothetical protein SAMN05216299_101222 [Nitrosospira sp. Nsp14]|uniref:hypothetical protein n=1 Tax=Nitrosospira sp. Nsp14 TaxID=1855333 RepID=UPI0008EEF49D|nr:hypothetical protein [Nitrosospira sp. Nsp14]SFH15579.1 hypothetical protein SAMN05216299_101222 [Nitrosospira sp. Nsp14]